MPLQTMCWVGDSLGVKTKALGDGDLDYVKSTSRSHYVLALEQSRLFYGSYWEVYFHPPHTERERINEHKTIAPSESSSVSQ